MNAIEQALKIAVMAYEGKVDNDGIPTIVHLITVAFTGESEEEIVVGLLQRILAETDVTSNFLKAAGFSPYIIQTIELLSNKQLSSEELRGSFNPLAIRVKLTELDCLIKKCKISKQDKLVEKYTIEKEWLSRFYPKRFTCKHCASKRKLDGQYGCIAFFKIPQKFLDGAEHLCPCEGQINEEVFQIPIEPPYDEKV